MRRQSKQGLTPQLVDSAVFVPQKPTKQHFEKSASELSIFFQFHGKFRQHLIHLKPHPLPESQPWTQNVGKQLKGQSGKQNKRQEKHGAATHSLLRSDVSSEGGFLRKERLFSMNCQLFLHILSTILPVESRVQALARVCATSKKRPISDQGELHHALLSEPRRALQSPVQSWG